VPAALLLGEYIWRHHRSREHRHASLVTLIANIVTGQPVAFAPPRSGDGETPMSTLPIARYRHADEPLLIGPHGRIGAGAFFAAARRLAAALPEGRYIINLCDSRSAFMTGFAAALLRARFRSCPRARDATIGSSCASITPGLRAVRSRHRRARGFRSQRVLVRAVRHRERTFGHSAHRRRPGRRRPVHLRQHRTPTAHPKTWGRLWQGAASWSAALGWDASPHAAIIGSVPPQHMFGLEATVVLPCSTASRYTRTGRCCRPISKPRWRNAPVRPGG